MTFTYADPNNSDLEAVRYRIQDTDSDRPLLSDEEIEYELEEAGDNVLQAALSCTEVLIARGAHKVTKTIGQMTINYSDLTAQYQTLAASLEAKITKSDTTYSTPEAGDVSDVAGYPAAFEPSDLSQPDWSDDDA